MSETYMKTNPLEEWKGSRTGFLTNHTGYGWGGDYHFKSLESTLEIKRVFIPEHGLFAELQDQVSGKGLQYFSRDIEFWNLYGDTEESLSPPRNKLDDLDLIVFDIRDVGSRYYTFLTTCFYILQKLSSMKRSGQPTPRVLVFEAPNPIGNKVEGSPLKLGYSSFVGVEGVLHRHGMTSWELMEYYNREYSLGLEISKIPVGVIHPQSYDHFLWIPPSPNIPSITTCYVYPGMCLLEGTNLSEGRGTTRPFEVVGAPFIDWENEALKKELESINQYFLGQSNSFFLRPLRFKPTFHKHSGEICGGFQIHITDIESFHSLLFGLHFIRTIYRFYPNDFEFLQGVYEFRSDKPAIELLVGDPFLLDYIKNENNIRTETILEYLTEEEINWKKVNSEIFSK